jgi:hypothetical protein
MDGTNIEVLHSFVHGLEELGFWTIRKAGLTYILGIPGATLIFGLLIPFPVL